MSALVKIVKGGVGAVFTVFDYIELIVIACFGSALFGATIWGISKVIIENGSRLYLGLFVLFIFISVGSIVRDIINKKFEPVSKGFMACWGVCVLFAGWVWFS